VGVRPHLPTYPSELFFLEMKCCLMKRRVTSRDDSLSVAKKQFGSAVRTNPAAGASVLLPLTPSTNYAATILMCGGQNINNWTVSPGLVNHVASTDCVRIEPDESGTWSEDASLPEGRTMGNFILLPDGKIFLTNGAQQGAFFVFRFYFFDGG